MGNILVVVQVALSLVLVIAAGLFMRTFSSLANLDLGFERDPVVVVSVSARQLALEPADRAPFFERVREAVQGVPGVASSALSAVTPVSGSTWQFLVEIPGGPDLPERERGVHVNLVSPDFFKTMGTRVIGGRDFTAADRRGAPDVVIVNEAFAKKFFNGQNPVGRIVKQPPFPDRPGSTHAVVGYVQDAVYRSPRQAIPPTMYLPLAQHPEPPVNINLSVRAAGGSPALLIKPLADALTGVNKDLTVTFRPLAEQVNAALIQERVIAMLSGFFGALALLLAGLGLYGVTSYAVSRRRAELGIRMALGAGPGGVVRLVLGRVALLVGAGIALGIGLGIAGRRPGLEVPDDAALRTRGERSTDVWRGRDRPRGDRRAGRVAARPPCVADRPGGCLTAVEAGLQCRPLTARPSELKPAALPTRTSSSTRGRGRAAAPRSDGRRSRSSSRRRRAR